MSLEKKGKIMNLDKYFEKEVGYLMAETLEYDRDFISLLEKHKGIYNLTDRTKAILKDAGYVDDFWDNEVDKYQNLKGWVYKYYAILRDAEEAKIQTESNRLKEILKNRIGEKVNIVIRGTTVSGYDTTKENKFKIIKDAVGKILLMPPRAKRKGFILDHITILEVK